MNLSCVNREIENGIIVMYICIFYTFRSKDADPSRVFQFCSLNIERSEDLHIL
jgi:hypothetical protein